MGAALAACNCQGIDDLERDEGMPATTLGGRIATWVCGLDGQALSPAVLPKLKLAALDTLASMLAGAKEDVVLRLIPFAIEQTGRAEASIIGYPARVGLPAGALVNGTMAHACDFDDSSWTMWGHPSAPVLPAALAVAERENLSGISFLTGFAAGLEVEKVLGLGCQPEHYQRGYHPTGSLGVFGAAAAAAKMLGLNINQTQMAFGLAVSRAASVRGNFGTMTKPLHVGFASRDGLEAGLLAEKGITSNPAAFEGHMGFFQVLAPDHGDVERLADSLGHPFEVLSPGLSPKLYPSCSEGHAAVDAILEMRVEGLKPSDVRRIRCGVTPAAKGNLVYTNPVTPLQAKFSQEYCLAAALVRGKLSLAEFDADAVNDAAIKGLMARIEVSVHPDLSGADSVTFSSPAIVEVETNGGKVFKKLIREMRGHPKNPLSPSDVEAKFVDCAARILPERKYRNALEKIKNLERLDSIRELVEQLRPD
jgi:2-methylcitrate dehydratase PrpD